MVVLDTLMGVMEVICKEPLVKLAENQLDLLVLTILVVVQLLVVLDLIMVVAVVHMVLAVVVQLMQITLLMLMVDQALKVL
jgi:hypothetical protein